VIKFVSDDPNNALVSYAAKHSKAVQARADDASTESEKSAIWEKAQQGASYSLGDAISTNSKSRDKRTVTCSGLLSATVEDTTAQKQVDFKVVQMSDGKVSVSVSPFQF
jgi:type II secretory pathway predicted ATPase ExeA